MKQSLYGIFCATTIVALSGQAMSETFWRWSQDGGASWTDETSSVFAFPAFADGGSAESNLIEILADCTASTGTQWNRPFTLRSGAGGVRTITFGGTANLSAPLTAQAVVSNIVLSGGVVWSNKSKVADLGRNSGNETPLFHLNTAASDLTLGPGCVLTNFFMNCNFRGAICGEAGKLTMLDGARIVDCRGCECVIDICGSSCVFEMKGGEVTRCYNKWNRDGFFGHGIIGDCRNMYGGTMKFSGGWIHDNFVEEGGAVALQLSGSRVHLSGSIRITNNKIVDGGVAANLCVDTANKIVQTGDFDATASVGVSCSVAAAEGAVFGSATDAGLTGASGALFCDSNPNGLVGSVDSETLNLVWAVPVLETLEYTSADAVFEGDGATARTIPDVVVMTPSSGATVTYATSRDGTYAATKPTFTAPGLYPIWYKIEAAGYHVVNEARLLLVNDPNVADTTVRIRNAGGSWLEGRFTTFSLPPFAGGTVEGNVVEVLADCTLMAGTKLIHPFTLRSAPGSVRTLTYANRDSSADGRMNYLSADVVVSNIVLFGGVKWHLPDDLTSEWKDKGDAVNLFQITDGAEVTLGSGTVVSNFYNGGSFRGTLAVMSGRVTMLDGSRIIGCRCFSSIVDLYGADASFVMRGGEITRCCVHDATVYYAVGIIGGDKQTTSASKIELSGGFIHGNLTYAYGAVALSHGDTGSAAMTCEISGSPVVRDNHFANGKLANVCARSATQIRMSGDLTGAARVGVSCAAAGSMVQDGVFGSATGDYSGAEAFRCDSDRLCGKLTTDGNRNLVWSKTGLAIIVR